MYQIGRLSVSDKEAGTLKKYFAEDIEAIQPKVVEWRRRIHQHPELSFKEFETTAYIEGELSGLEHITIEKPLDTGLVVRLKGAKPGPRIALRADIDALPMTELNEIEFKSQYEGVMHSCGHDTHTAMLMGAVHVLSRHQAELAGEYVFIFQPAEELPPGGAVEMVKAGVLDGVSAVLGQHVTPKLPAGVVGVTSGPISANSDRFEVTITGAGGHASTPQLCIDPLPVAAELIGMLQQIRSRQVDPSEPGVLSVTSIHGGTTNNIIPDSVTMAGTVRTYSPEVKKKFREGIAWMAKEVSHAGRCEAEVTYEEGYPSTVNDETLTGIMVDLVKDFYGPDYCVKMSPSLGGEDFSYYTQVVPGCFFHLGTANEEKGYVQPNHNTRFMVEEGAFLNGVTLLVNGAIAFSEHFQEK